ncbi:MAG: hypothetical protein A49_16940 [Methyloceanibacter sp.]|nr:MAG: hypothetical protein A49_16940 [Methyloceanibacter sp.]
MGWASASRFWIIGSSISSGQPPADSADAIANIRRGIVRIAVELEGDGYLARFLAADRGDEVDALDAGKRVLENLGDLRLHDGGTGTGIIGLHRNHRRIDRRILPDAEPVVGDEAHQDEDEAHHGGEYRPLDREFGKGHAARSRCR